MIRVTLEFSTVEETIVALGKMSALGKARRAANAGAEAPSVSSVANQGAIPEGTPAAPAPTRKPRNDAGKPRGPYKQNAASQLSTAGNSNAPSQEGVWQGDVAAAPAPAGKPRGPYKKDAKEGGAPAMADGVGSASHAEGAACVATDAPAPSEAPAPAGKPRGPYKGSAGATLGTGDATGDSENGTTGTGKAADQAANPMPTTPDAQGASASTKADPTLRTAAPEMESPPEARKDHEPVAAVPSAEDVQKALERLFEAAPPKGGIEVARNTLATFDVTRLRDLPEGKRAEFIRAVDKALA